MAKPRKIPEWYRERLERDREFRAGLEQRRLRDERRRAEREQRERGRH
jgi:hypothetical protein